MLYGFERNFVPKVLNFEPADYERPSIWCGRLQDHTLFDETEAPDTA